MSVLSVFVDESGNVSFNSERYLVGLVFHDQSRPIDAELVRLGARLREIGFDLGAAIHTGPCIRRDEMFADMEVPERKRVFTSLYTFTRRAGVSYRTFAFRKSEVGARCAAEVPARLQARISREVSSFLRERLAYFAAFDRVVVYYDNGQDVVARAIREAFGSSLTGVEFRLAFPHQYRLLQSADFVCTLEQLRLKADEGGLTRSDLLFFGSARRLRRDYLRHVGRLRMP